jgi:Cu+-exporting ATPase
MHPEVRQDHPGTCPKCGMALEPVLPEPRRGENPELVDFQRRFWWTLPLTIVGHRCWPCSATARLARHGRAELDRAGPVAARRAVGRLAVLRARRAVGANRSPNMWTLIGLGHRRGLRLQRGGHRGAGLFPDSFVSMGRVAVYFEAAAVIISLTLLGQLLELKARSQTSAAIKSLLGLAPKTARRIGADGSEEDIPLTHVHVGDRCACGPARRCPSTAWWSRAAARSTSPCSPASRCR